MTSARPMAKRASLDHPAARAWRALHPGAAQTWKIRTLKHSDKSAVYRLNGAWPSGSTIVAKHSRQSTLMIERAIYEEILPQLPVTALHCYGFLEESMRNLDSKRLGWLFLEDASGAQYSSRIKIHRTLAARWLGALHTSAVGLVKATALPARGPGYYLAELQEARKSILRSFENPVLGANDRGMLKAIVAQCDFAEGHWKDVEDFCRQMPNTLVHGDFVRKNVRVRQDGIGVDLYVLDWETAGWGNPAPDISSVEDIQTYHQTVRKTWTHLDLQDVQRLWDYGSLFRLLTAMHWDSLSLPHSSVDDDALENLWIYHAWMTDCVRALGWEGPNWPALPRWLTRNSQRPRKGMGP
jgi:thiamine kinase-like enzyme